MNQSKRSSFSKSTPERPYGGREGLVYARVSSRRQETEGTGLQSQEERCKSDLRSIEVPCAKTFRDSFSGGGDFMQRPAMREMLAYIDAHSHKEYVVVFDDLKRFARDIEFHIKLRTAFRSRNVELRCLNYRFDESAEGRFVEHVLASAGQLEREQNARQVRQKMRARLEAGYWPFSRKKGYDTVKDPMHGKIQVPNKDGKTLKAALEAFSSGNLPRKMDFCRYLVERGFWKRARPPEKYLDDAALLLSDPFHAGFIEYSPWEVERRPGHHKGIISIATFENIQKRLQRPQSSSRIRRDIAKDFPLRGLINCVCGDHLTAAWTKGRSKSYAYYTCHNKSCEFYGKSLLRDVVEKRFNAVLKETRLRDDVGKLLGVVFDRVWDEEMHVMEKQEKVVIRRAHELRETLRDLTTLARKARNEQLRRAYELQIEETALELESPQNKTIDGIDPTVPYRTALGKARVLLKNPYKAWQKLGVEEQHELFFFVFDQKLTHHPVEGYRTAQIPTAVRLFEDFVLAKPSSVDQWGIEPQTSSLQMRHSTTELLALLLHREI